MLLCKNKDGFSFIEMLIVTAISSILFIAIFQNYYSSKNIYILQDNTIELSENTRIVNYFLWKNIIQAGFAGCRKFSDLDIKNHTQKNFDLTKNIYGYDYKQIPKNLVNKVKYSTDVLIINKVNVNASRLTDDVIMKTNMLKVDKHPATEDKRYLLVSDCKKGELFFSKNSSGKNVHIDSVIEGFYDRKSGSVFLFEELLFFIGNSKRKDQRGVAKNGLYFSINGGRAEELVHGVTDMQIFYTVKDVELTAFEVDRKDSWGEVEGIKIELIMESFLNAPKKRTMYVKLRI